MKRQASYQILCLNCGAAYDEKVPWNAYGCVKCRNEKFVSNLTLRLALDEVKPLNWGDKENGHGIWRYSSLLPVPPQYQLSLGEGGTPLLQVDKLASEIGLRNIYIKDESRNPTFSHKDRLASVGVSKALELGARVVTVSSTGNHGAAIAAYAAKAGISCVVFTVESAPLAMKVLVQVYGAIVVSLPSMEDRWVLMNKCIEAYGWYATGNPTKPPVGSIYYGIEGYKTIAFEIQEQLGGDIPDAILVPTAYGDMIYGIWKGFLELKDVGLCRDLPKMIAVETLGSLENALAKGLRSPEEVPYRSTPAFSTAAPMSTFQALKAVRESGGIAVTIKDDNRIMSIQHELAHLEGIYGEAASVTSVAALVLLKERKIISVADKLVCIMTSTGLKDPASTSRHLGPLLSLEGPDVEKLIREVRITHGLDLGK